jgi:DNA oxidative demethylase
MQRHLFDVPPPPRAAPPVPGLVFRTGFLTPDEEAFLLHEISGLTFREFTMHGVVARRRVAHFGWDYGYQSWSIRETAPIPDWLVPLRDRGAALAGLAPRLLEQALVTYYPRGAGIGWHRDAPMFGPTVVGVSLLGDCEMRFRRLKRRPRERSERLLLPRRSAYVLSGEARSDWQHGIPELERDRYAITFRTVRTRPTR